MAGIAWAAYKADQWVILVAAGVLAAWMATLVLRACARRIKEEFAGTRRILSAWRGRHQRPSGARIARSGDAALRDRLILTYAPLVKFVAGRISSGLPSHVDENDLVSYGLLGPDRRDRALRPRPRREVRDVRDRADQGLDHRRAARDGLGAAFGPLARPRDRARDREARGGAPPLADRRGDRREARHRGGGARQSLLDISRSSIAALDELWTVSSSTGDQVALIDTIEDREGPQPDSRARRDGDEGGDGRGDRRPARAREDRRHALLLRGADAPRDRRGARRDRVPRLAAAHEGDPAAPRTALRRGRPRRCRQLSNSG